MNWRYFFILLVAVSCGRVLCANPFDSPVTFITKDGQHLEQATVTAAEAEEITFNTATGVVRLPYNQLPPEIGSRYFTFEAAGKRVEGGYVHGWRGTSVIFFTDSGPVEFSVFQVPLEVKERLGLTPEVLQRFEEYSDIRNRLPVTKRHLRRSIAKAPRQPVKVDQARPNPVARNVRPVPLDVIRKWVVDICLDPNDEHTRRWTVAPLVSCFGANGEEQQVFDKAVQ